MSLRTSHCFALLVLAAACHSDGSGADAASVSPDGGVDANAPDAASDAGDDLGDPVDAHDPVYGVYGPAFGADSKGNQLVGIGGRMLAHRFRASTSSTVTSVVWQRRLGPPHAGAPPTDPGYSGGDGGTAHVTLQTDDGTPSHAPSGVVLASLDYKIPTPTMANSTGIDVRLAFPTPAAVTKGQLYHMVWENKDATPDTNYFSVNELYSYDASAPRQPAWPDLDYALLTRRGATGAWVHEGEPNLANGAHTPVMEVAYADGHTDGSAYFAVGAQLYYGTISGASRVRELFTVSTGDHVVTAAWVRINRQAGTGDVTLHLQAGDGTEIEAVTPKTNVVSWVAGSVGGRGTWVGATFQTPHVLENGKTYQLVLTAPADTTLAMIPIQHTQDNTTDGSGDPNRSNVSSRAFREGVAQKSSDGGATWAPMYPYSPMNTQMYFVTVE